MMFPWRRAERATIRIDPCDPSPEFLRRCFAEVFASLDANPRLLIVDVYAECESLSEVVVTMVDGNPVFIIDGNGVTCADFRRRWLAEHPVPLVFRRRGVTRLLMSPTSGNRVKVRLGLTRLPAFW
jgi:hypothetical protein